MAEFTAARNNALGYPVYGVPWVLAFPLLDADGDLVTGATTPDSEVSKNGDAFADCTNEMVEIATGSGIYYLNLTATEMTADIVAVICKSATAGMKTTSMVMYPKKLPQIRSGTAAGGAVGSITLDSGASLIDDYYNGCLVVATLDGSVEARVISNYVGSTRVASVSPNWNTTPDADDTFIIYHTEIAQFSLADVIGFAGVAATVSAGVPAVNTTLIEGVDATNQIRDSVVDDATRIDASALNTLSSHDPGSIISSSAEITAVFNLLNPEIADIKAKTDNLPSDPADASVIAGLIAALEAKVDIIDTTADSILVDTAEIGVAGAGLTAIPWNAAWDAEVESEVADALAVYDGPTKAELDAAVAPLATSSSIADIESHLDAQDTDIAALPTAAENATELLDQSNGIETGYTLRMSMRIILAANAGKSSGHGTGTVIYRNPPDTADRITATVSAGNRTAVTLVA